MRTGNSNSSGGRTPSLVRSTGFNRYLRLRCSFDTAFRRLKAVRQTQWNAATLGRKPTIRVVLFELCQFDQLVIIPVVGEIAVAQQVRT